MEDIGFSMFIGDAIKNTITLFGAGVWSDLLDEKNSLDHYSSRKVDQAGSPNRGHYLAATANALFAKPTASWRRLASDNKRGRFFC